MKNILSIATALALVFLVSSCEKDNNPGNGGSNGSNCNNPHTAAPSGIAGNWANGFVSMTQILDAYTGKFLGNTWQSAKYFAITPDGRNAEFYFMAQSQFSKTATKATGSIAFDPGSNSTQGSFTFYACSARYRGWGSMTVDRDATQSELANNLTSKYFYRVEGQWLRIQPGGPVNDYSSSFRLVN
jgi:hypothetical protein